ncbi:MAG: hypothetical protein LBC03_06605 [Nitrososphaerota archaeon]|jgi:uncharacterized protein YwgA|nr:hypothetical protein [Nitrososphaerota archaeon]
MSDVTSKLFASLAALGINPKMETFGERKCIQKTVYLLDKVFGLDFGYYYSWYLHGPYSPQVTQIIYDVVEGRKIVEQQTTPLSSEDTYKIECLKAFLKDDINVNDKLELLVSVDYLLNCTVNSQNVDPTEQEIIEFLNLKKPWFSNEEIKTAIHRMQELKRK